MNFKYYSHFLITGFTRILAPFIVSILCLLALPVSAQSTSEHTVDNVSTQSLKAVHFAGGWFKLIEAGKWGEYLANGQLRFEFDETGRDEHSIYLRNQRINVDIQIDTHRRMISGTWPGHPKSDIYTITKFEGALRPVAPPTPTPIPRPTPVPTPAPVPPKPETPKSGWVSPANLVLIQASHARFEKNRLSQWLEYSPSGNINTYEVLGFSDRSLYLQDNSQDIFLDINLNERLIYSGTGGKMEQLSEIISVSDMIEAPQPKPVENGKFSFKDRALCLAAGGKVERAGMLGFERCTKRYSDGGMICSDSAQCQGMCEAPQSVSTNDITSGTCQIDDNPFGCKAFVEAGRATPALCVD